MFQSPYSITGEIGRRSIVYINRYEIKSLAIDIARFIDQQVANVYPRGARCPKIKSTQSACKHANIPGGALINQTRSCIAGYLSAVIRVTYVKCTSCMPAHVYSLV